MGPFGETDWDGARGRGREGREGSKKVGGWELGVTVDRGGWGFGTGVEVREEAGVGSLWGGGGVGSV